MLLYHSGTPHAVGGRYVAIQQHSSATTRNAHLQPKIPPIAGTPQTLRLYGLRPQALTGRLATNHVGGGQE